VQIALAETTRADDDIPAFGLALCCHERAFRNVVARDAANRVDLVRQLGRLEFNFVVHHCVPLRLRLVLRAVPNSELAAAQKDADSVCAPLAAFGTVVDEPAVHVTDEATTVFGYAVARARLRLRLRRFRRRLCGWSV